MNKLTRLSFVIPIVLGILILADGVRVCSQEKQPPKRFKSTVVELTEDAPSDWLLKEAKVGIKIMSGRDYIISDLPEEMQGGTLIVRPNLTGGWLPNNALTALKDGTVYCMMRTKALKKTVIGEEEFTKLEKEGWKEVEGDVGTSFPSGEDWQWKAYKKSIKKGAVILQLKKLDLNRQSLVFIFKE